MTQYSPLQSYPGCTSPERARCRSPKKLTNQGILGFLGRGHKETGTTMDHLRQRVNIDVPVQTG